MKILITGSSGLIGGVLMQRLAADGHEIVRLIRRPVRDPEHELRWSPRHGRIDRDGVANMDAVIHLAGKNVAAGRWNDRLKQEIQDSRVDSTELLANTMAELRKEGRGPSILLSTSATGFYGSRGDDTLTESASPGEGFLADVCMDWEDAAKPARDAGVRVAHMRLGVVLTRDGGMLPKLEPLFRLGLGGPIGDGQQWFPWVHVDDVADAFAFALTEDSLSGPVNVTAPNPVRHGEFVKALGKVLNRPTVIPVPAALAELAMGKEMARDMVLASQRVVPEKLVEHGFAFRYAQVDDALRAALG
ncbi:TIGR01777 family oxidoreductase [bacterium]|nr:TIGR01777 family oxidoreductase [bacterium]